MDILVISMAGIGDTLFATPFIHELRANFPTARLDVLVRWPGSRDILQGNPHLNTVYQKNLLSDSPSDSLTHLLRLRKERYDVSFNTHPQSRIHYRMVARFINAKVRVSHQYDNVSFMDGFLINQSLKQDYERHSIENNLDLLKFVGAGPRLPKHEYELFLSRAESDFADEFISGKKLAGRQLLGMHVGSGGTKNLALRRWPLENYIELTRRFLAARPNSSCIVLGGPEEDANNQEMVKKTDSARVFYPRTKSLREAAAVISKCDTFVSVDTSLMHVAAAVKVKRQLVIETPTWNKAIQPYRDSFVLIKNSAVSGRNLDYYRYDGHGIRGTAAEIKRCMASVTVDTVLKSVLEE